jgi:hypothetical protein
MALAVDYLSKLPQFAGKTKPLGTVLQLKAKYIKSSHFITNLGDKLDALCSTSPRYAECDDNIHSVWSPGLNLFERLGGEVFDIDASPSSEDEHKRDAARENRKTGETYGPGGTGEKNSLKTPTKPTVESQRQSELSEALRWTISVTTAR